MAGDRCCLQHATEGIRFGLWYQQTGLTISCFKIFCALYFAELTAPFSLAG